MKKERILLLVIIVILIVISVKYMKLSAEYNWRQGNADMEFKSSLSYDMSSFGADFNSPSNKSCKQYYYNEAMSNTYVSSHLLGFTTGNLGGTGASAKEVLVKSRKQELKVKLDTIQKDLETSEEKKECDIGSSFGMRAYAGKEYTEWDKALNEIYAVLKQQLSSDDMKKLEIEELNWIKEKEEKGWKAGANFEGGDLESICCVDTEAYETKERCYELVDKYMK